MQVVWGAPAAQAPAVTRPVAQMAPSTTRHPSLADMQQRVGTLERRLANLESTYMELLAMLAPLAATSWRKADPTWKR